MYIAKEKECKKLVEVCYNYLTLLGISILPRTKSDPSKYHPFKDNAFGNVTLKIMHVTIITQGSSGGTIF